MPTSDCLCLTYLTTISFKRQGAPNAQLLKEGLPPGLEKYNGKSIAEQNSFDLFWCWFVSDEFSNLRKTICSTDFELMRLRDLIINSVMATDIADKDLKLLRDARWAKAFSNSIIKDDNPKDSINRKATIVIEHLIQASDISHTMQHWHVYRQWNEKFFFECMKAYMEGRAENDPSKTWYKGEIGFFG